MGDYFILEGKIPIPVDMMTWAMWHEDHHQDRIVKQENVAHYWISTVFLGLDHSWGPRTAATIRDNGIRPLEPG